MRKIIKYAKYIIIGILVITITLFFFIKKDSVEIQENTNLVSEETSETAYIYVDIKGEINNPGVIKVPEGSRIVEIIELAGGLTDNADTSTINLSQIPEDESVIYINKKSLELADSKISLNNGTKEELMTLPGIGESKANNIIEYRKSHTFSKIEEITNVSGIGESIFVKIKTLITL